MAGEKIERYYSNSGFYDITFAPGENECEWTVKKVNVFFDEYGDSDAPVDVAIPDSFDGKPITDINGWIAYKLTLEWSENHPAYIGKITIGRNVRKISLLELWEEEFESLLIPKTVVDLEELGVDSYNPSPIYFENEEMFKRYYSDEYAINVLKYSEVAPVGSIFDLQNSWHYNDAGLPVSWYEELKS